MMTMPGGPGETGTLPCCWLTCTQPSPLWELLDKMVAWYASFNYAFHFLKFFLFFNGHKRSIWKFPGQGLNASCSCGHARTLKHCAGLGWNLRCHRDNARSLTCCTKEECPWSFIYLFIFKKKKKTKKKNKKTFMAVLRHMEFQDQGSDLSCGSSNTLSLTHCVGPGIEPASLAPEMQPILLHHSGNS